MTATLEARLQARREGEAAKPEDEREEFVILGNDNRQGERLKQAREAIGLSIAEAAHAVNTDAAAWQRWESGDADLGNNAADELLLIAILLAKPVEWLIYGDHELTRARLKIAARLPQP